MKNKITKAVEAGDIGSARVLIIELLDKQHNRKDAIEAVRFAVKSLPELFEEEDGTIMEYGGSEDATVVKERLAVHLGKNFSREKLAYYTQLCTRQQQEPAVADAVDEAIDRIAVVNNGDKMQETVDELHFDNFNVPMVGSPEHADGPAIIAEESEALTDEDKEDPGTHDMMKDLAARPDTPGAKKGRIAGYVIIILGIITSIVGIAIPLFFLIGIGIGVIFTGAFVTYANLRN